MGIIKPRERKNGENNEWVEATKCGDRSGVKDVNTVKNADGHREERGLAQETGRK